MISSLVIYIYIYIYHDRHKLHSLSLVVKGNQAYNDSWATVLGKGMPCLKAVSWATNIWPMRLLWWQLGQNFLNYEEQKTWYVKVWSFTASCCKHKNYKTAKIYSKANTTFSQNSASAKLSRYMVCLCDPYSKFHWPSLPSYGGWIKAWTSRSGAVPDEKLTCNKW